MSLLNAATAMAMTLVNGLLGIVVTWFVIAEFGDDFNGLNSTANQIVNLLLILEGGFTVASNVALFGPLGRQETDVVNGILSATRKKFRKIGGLFLLIGLAVAAVYSFAVNSTLSWDFVFTLIVMTVVPAAFNLYYATTYRVLIPVVGLWACVRAVCCICTMVRWSSSASVRCVSSRRALRLSRLMLVTICRSCSNIF